MSNIEPEQPQEPPRPNITYVPPPIPGQQFQDWSIFKNMLEGITALNATIRAQTEDITSMLQGHTEELQKGNAAIQDRIKLNRTVQGEVSDDLDQGAGLVELERRRNEQLQKQVSIVGRREEIARETERRIQEATASPAHQIRAIAESGIVQSDLQGRRYIQVGSRQYETQEVYAAIQKPAEERTGSEQRIVQAVNAQMQQAIQDRVIKQSESRIGQIFDNIEEAGIRQLRYGQLPLQDILRAAGTLAGKAYTRRAAQMDLEAARAEAEAAAVETPTTPVEGEPPQEGGAAGGGGVGRDIRTAAGAVTLGRFLGVGGAARGIGLGMGGLSLATRALPLVGQALAIGTVLNQAFTGLSDRFYRGPERAGQVTGEGWRAGVHARFRQFQLGLNPLDMVSNEMAQEIVNAVREQGFTGHLGDSIMDAVKGTINDLGITPVQATEFYTDAIRRGQMTVAEARQEMEHFDDAAHDLSINVSDYTRTVLETTQSLRQAGAGAAAPTIAQAVIASLPPGYAQQAPQIFQAVQQNAGIIAARMGIAPQMVLSQRYAGAATQQLTSIMGTYIPIARTSLQAMGIKSPNNNDIANWLAQFPQFQGLGPELIQRMLEQRHRGLGVQHQQAIYSAIQQYQGGYHALLEHAKELQRERGVTAGNVRVGIRGAAGLPGPGGGPEDQISRAALIDLRSRILSEYRDTLGDHYRTMMQHLGDRSFDFEGELRKAVTGRKGKDIGAAVQAGGVQIALKPGIERRLFQLENERQKAVQAGLIPANKQP